MNKKYFIANWKMNLGVQDGISFSNSISNSLREKIGTNLEVIICPPSITLPYCYQILKTVSKLGAQNISHLDSSKGAFTGEISSEMVSDYADYVIIGHSERRINMNETNHDASLKGRYVLNYNMTPIICIGESDEQRDSGNYIDFLLNQLKESSKGIEKEMIVAYEPIWAIGSGNSCNIEQVTEISNKVKSIYGEDMPFVYGGSVNESNVEQFFINKGIDGVLVGSASLNVESFEKMLSLIDEN